MDWHNNRDALSDLPPAEEDEPTNLRQDIADELADHLDCAMQHELQESSNEEQARSKALKKFGNPRRIAAQLWFDWMKEKIMTRRLNQVTTTLLAITCVAAICILFVSLRQSQATNLAILTKLEALSTQPAATLDWTEFKVACVTESLAGSPAEGCKIELIGKAINPNDDITLERKTNAGGRVSLGLIRPGEYSLRITSPGGDLAIRNVIVQPGPARTETIVCPATLPQADVSFEIAWPAEVLEKFDESSLLIHCVFLPNPSWYSFGDEDWVRDGASGRMLTFLKDGQIYLSRSATNPGMDSLMYEGDLVSNYLNSEPLQSTVRLPLGNYQLAMFSVIVKEDVPENNSCDSLRVRAKCTFEKGEPAPELFQVSSSEQNHWKIDLPKKFVEQLLQDPKKDETVNKYGFPTTGSSQAIDNPPISSNLYLQHGVSR